ncbi:MAG: T9SS type A sorting domain-containing protein, partial [Candidatus Cloacimonetes bacterium]|nr:T9SS type A sorting domain-containing protein [Candidatus Cloacimonadota bacterium]
NTQNCSLNSFLHNQANFMLGPKISQLPKSKLAIFVDENNVAYLVWKLNILPKSGGDWYILVDAHSGTIRKKDNIEINETGDGRVFDPDPATYFEDITLPDNNDEDYPELYDSYKFRDLEGINPPVGGQYYLRGEYAYSEDINLPYDPVSFESTPVFHYNRSQNGFEETNCYYHLDKTIRYVRSMGFNPLWNNQTGDNNEDIVFDARGRTDINASYSPSGEYILYGVPANWKDAGEDQSVIIHELGHAFHDALIIGGIDDAGYYSECRGISEGISDYFGIDYRRQLSYFLPNDRCNWFWPGLEPTIKIPDEANFTTWYTVTNPYIRMRTWASSLMDLEYIEATDPSQGYRLGQDVVSILQLASLSYVTWENTAEDNVFAMYQSDIDIYGGAHLIDLIEVYSDRQLFDDQIINEDVIYTSNTSWDGYKLVRANVTVQNGATLTIEPGTYVFLDGAELIIDENSNLIVNGVLTLSGRSLVEVTNGSKFALKPGSSLYGTEHEILVDEHIIPGDRIIIQDGGYFIAKGTETDSIYIDCIGYSHWDGITINGIGDSINTIEHCNIANIGHIVAFSTNFSFYKSSFTNSGQLGFYNTTVSIKSSEYSNNSNPIYSYESWNTIIGNTIENNDGGGIFVSYPSSNTNSIHENIIRNNLGKGIQLYDVPGKFYENNISNNTSHGFVALGNANRVVMRGSIIEDNGDSELFATRNCFPNLYAWGGNTIADSSYISGSSDQYLLMCGRYDGIPIDCRGNNIITSDTTRFYPYFSAYIFDGEKPPDKVLYDQGIVLINDNEFESAKITMKDIVYYYPETATAENALQWLMYLEKFSGHDYAGLRDYIETVDEVSYPHLERVKYNTTTSTYMAEDDYETAIDRHEIILTNPPSVEDSVFSFIDEGYCYLKLDEQGGKAASVECSFKPRSFKEFQCFSQDLIKNLLDKAITTIEPSTTDFESFALYQNYPNPMRSSTTISFSTAEGIENAEIKIYNIKGQLVKQFSINNDQTSIVWDGKDSNGKQLSSGIYLYLLSTGKKSITKRMVLLR